MHRKVAVLQEREDVVKAHFSNCLDFTVQLKVSKFSSEIYKAFLSNANATSP